MYFKRFDVTDLIAVRMLAIELSTLPAQQAMFLQIKSHQIKRNFIACKKQIS